MSRMLWLPTVLSQAGLKVYAQPGWETRGSATIRPKGVLWHHTATGTNWTSKKVTDLLVNGRPDLRGPLSQLQLNRDGSYIIIASGKANHAGSGSWPGVRFGNTELIGIEATNDGRGEPWPAEQIYAYIRGTAAILNYLNAPANMCFGHKEWAPSRKIDPRGIDMDLMRAKVAEEQQSLRSPVEQKAKPDVSKKKEESSIDDFCKKNILKLRSRGSCVKSLQEKLNGLGINVGKADGIFGNKTLAGVKTFQARNGLKADGIVGPRTWAKLV